jgi:hypothetical protein
MARRVTAPEGLRRVMSTVTAPPAGAAAFVTPGVGSGSVQAPRAATPAVRGHHGSHTALLRPAETTLEPPAGEGAIVVPTARPHTYLREVADLARRLDMRLLLLCSRWADASRAVDQDFMSGVKVIAADVNELVRLPEFETTRLLAGKKFAQRTDISLKRNIGLAVAHMLGLSHVLFLDDDIRVDHADDVRQAAALVRRFAAVGLTNAGFPDNSVVCHAFRAVGGRQDQFIGGGAMMVPGDRIASFFPSIYNEDWFFLLNDDDWIGQVTSIGKVDQKWYDPFRDPDRARGEELGDTIAEGIYALLDDGKRVRDADLEYWRGYLAVRRELIAEVLERVEHATLPEADRGRIKAALKGAWGRQKYITAELCRDYVRAFVRDRASWRDYLAKLPTGVSTEAAFAHLDLRFHRPA